MIRGTASVFDVASVAVEVEDDDIGVALPCDSGVLDPEVALPPAASRFVLCDGGTHP